MVQLVTGGLKLSGVRPAGSEDAVDIVLRLPPDQRTIAALDQLRIQTVAGSVPIANFVTRAAVPTTGTLTRLDGARTVTVEAGIREGVQADLVRRAVVAALEQAGLEAMGIRRRLAGEDREQAEAMAFLVFGVLLAQFISFTPVALAGVVVNNNIVLIDTFDSLRRAGRPKIEAILQTCRERARPLVPTAQTAILGVLPIAFGLNIELLHHEVTIGAPSTRWWIALSSAIVYGLALATCLTLVIIPSLLMLVTRPDLPKPWFWQRAKRRAWRAGPQAAD